MIEDLKEVKEGLKKDPNNPYVLKRLASHYLGESNYKLAKAYYMQAVKLCPHLLSKVLLDYEGEILKDADNIGPRLSLVGFHLGFGEVDAAILELEETLENSPKTVEAYNVLGKIYIQQERIDETISLLERSIQEGIRDVALIEILAGAYLEKERTEEAIKFYNEVLVHRPGDKQILRVLGELYARLGDYTRAAQCYEAMFSDDPEVSREVVQRLEELLKKIEGSIYLREVLAGIYLKSLMPEAAVAKLREIVRLDSSKIDKVIPKLKSTLKNYPRHPEASLALGEILRIKGSFSEAAECYHDLVKTKPECLPEAVSGYKSILELCPEQVLARSYLAEAYLYKKQIKDALQEFENMVGVDPTTADLVVRKCREILRSQPQLLLAHLVLGRAYLANGEVQRAVTEVQEIIAIDQRFMPAYLLLGEAYFRLKLCRKAAETLSLALSIDPYNHFVQEKYREAKEKELGLEINSIQERLRQDQWKVSLRLDLAKLYIQKGEMEEAIRELQFVLKDQTRAPFACNLLGCVYRGEGRFDLAAAQFNRALELAPPEIADFARSVRFNLGTTYEAQGVVRKALKIYEGILQEDIDFGDLGKRVKYLKATSLQSMRNKTLIMVISKYGKNEAIALWGREGKATRRGRKEAVSLSFGQKHNTSGFEFFMKGMHKAAIEEFQLAVQLDAKFAGALNNWGVSLVKENKFMEAKSKFEEAVNLFPGSIVFRNNLGVVYFLLGTFDQAKKEFLKARDLDSELSAIAINQGDLFYALQEIEPAMKCYQQVGKFDVLTELVEQRLMYKVPS